MLEDFGGAPLSRDMAAELFGGQTGYGRRDLLLQSLKARVHEGLLTFLSLSVRMLRDK